MDDQLTQAYRHNYPRVTNLNVADSAVLLILDQSTGQLKQLTIGQLKDLLKEA